MSDILYIIVPCYNEEEVLPLTSVKLKNKLSQLINKDLANEKSKILFVDDGSTDNTWAIIENNHKSDAIFSGVKLSKNMGHQNALLAGLMTAMSLSDVTISLDADLQDDIECLDEFMYKYYGGCDIVYGVRADRATDDFFKRWSSQTYYKLVKRFGVDIIYNHADYRLMSKRALKELSSFQEVNLFLRGIAPLIGYKTDTVEYVRGKRVAGKTKYPLKKMLYLAWDGISSFSIKPLRYITILGGIMSFISIILLTYFCFQMLATGKISEELICIGSIWCIGSLQLLAIGIVGEYSGKIYMEVKKRPRYVIELILDTEANNN